MAFAGYAVATGLLAGNAAAAQAATFVFFPLVFLAPTFMPARTTPGLAAGGRLAQPDDLRPRDDARSPDRRLEPGQLAPASQ